MCRRFLPSPVNFARSKFSSRRGFETETKFNNSNILHGSSFGQQQRSEFSSLFTRQSFTPTKLFYERSGLRNRCFFRSPSKTTWIRSFRSENPSVDRTQSHFWKSVSSVSLPSWSNSFTNSNINIESSKNRNSPEMFLSDIDAQLQSKLSKIGLSNRRIFIVSDFGVRFWIQIDEFQF